MKKINFLFLILIILSAISVSSQNAPITTATTVKSNGPSFIVPITVANFNNIGACKLTLNYDPAILTATNVSMGSSFPFSNLAQNLTTPGTIVIQWFSTSGGGQTHPDNSVMFNISFNRIQSGTSQLTWFDNGTSCAWRNGSNVLLNDIPSATYYINGTILDHFAPVTTASVVSSCPGSAISIPVIVNDFYSIGSVSLILNYNSSVLTYQSSTTNPAYLVSVNGNIPGTIVVAGSSMSGTTLPDNTVLFSLNFIYNGGSTGLDWYDDGESCEYADEQFEVLPDTPQSTYYLDGSVGPNLQTEWIGLISNEWNNPGNWNCGLPDIHSNVIINAAPFDPVISTDVEVNSVIVNTGATLTVEPAASLTLGDLSNNAGNPGLLIRSDATGTGSLIHNSDNVPATIERYIAGSAVLEGTKYHMVSVPLTQSSNPLSGLFLDSYLYQWQSTQEWFSPGVPTDLPLNSGRGYMIYYPGTGKTYTFPGMMNNGSFTAVAVAGAEGYDLVPNPYPSAIDWDATSGWTKTNLYDATWIWNNGNYAAYVNGAGTNGGSRFIHAGQSFFIQANAALPGLSMNNSVRVHSNIPFLKNTETPEQLLRIKVQAGSYSDEMVVRVFPDATPTYDSHYDAAKFYGIAEAPQLYSLTPDQDKLSINSLKYSSEEQIIPIGFEYPAAESVTLNFEGQDGFNPETGLYLEDIIAGSTINLREQGTYTFNHNPAGDAIRFKLHLGQTYGINDPQNDAPYRIYACNGNVYISIPSLSGEKAMVEWFDLPGRKLGRACLTLNEPSVITPATTGRIIIVRVISGNKVFTQRLMLK